MCHRKGEFVPSKTKGELTLQRESHRLPLGVPALIEELESQGISERELFREAGIQRGRSITPGFQREELPVILNAAAHLSQLPETALNAGVRQKINHFGVFGYALVTSNTFGDAFAFGQDHIYQAGAIIEVNFIRQGDLGILQTSNPLMLGKNLQFVAEFWRSSMTTLLSEVLGRKFPSVAMYFPYQRPSYDKLYHQVFDCELNFSTETMEWHFDATVLDEPCPAADPMTSEICQDICDQIAIERGESRLIRAIRSVCITRSGQAIASAASVANALGMSLRTFQRRLADEGRTFKELLDETRYSIASEYLCKTDISIEEISARCGYGDVSNFRKAFHRWAGESPTRHRINGKS